jgi:hypothetical protein
MKEEPKRRGKGMKGRLPTVTNVRIVEEKTQRPSEKEELRKLSREEGSAI